uniref:Predicted protein n=1 Tax=Hordeum vulgare subsp. vulgare TaxID=112509 RepID=F2DC05_HORVV|nr:predicted protein [Hordeum vulgare subsp. vulgare]
MNNQCVPRWDLDETVGAGLNPVPAGSAQRMASGDSGLTEPVAMPMPDQYDEVAELTWEKGNIFWQGLFNRSVPKYPAAPAPAQMHAIGGAGDHRETLEAVVGEAAARLSTQSTSHLGQPLRAAAAPWLGVGAPADGLVPCARGDDPAEGDVQRKRARVVGEDGRVCASQGSAAPGRGESSLLTLEPCGTGADDLCGFTTTNNSTSLDQGSPETENTSFGGGASDSRCFSRRSQRDGLCDEAENVVVKGEAPMRSAISTKRSRAAAIHNESERKRRDRINQKMQTLQKLVPNSSKTDKASMLDEVIDHLKQLQATVQMMNRMSSMMMPMAMPQLAQMSVMTQMAQMAQMAQMGLGMMNMAAGPLAQPAYPGLAQPMMHPSTPFVPMQPWNAGAGADRQKQPAAAAAVPDAYSAFLACQAAQQNAQQQQQQQQQAQPNGMEAYSRMMAMYQKLGQQQTQPRSSKE